MPRILIWHHPISVLTEAVVLRCCLMKVVFEVRSLLLASSNPRCQNTGNIDSIYKSNYCKSPPTLKMWPDSPIFVFSGPNRLPAGGEERPGELEERPCEEDQNAGVCAEAREVSASPPTAASAHPQHTQIPQLVCNNSSVSMFCTLLKINSEGVWRRTWWQGSRWPTNQRLLHLSRASALQSTALCAFANG